MCIYSRYEDFNKLFFMGLLSHDISYVIFHLISGVVGIAILDIFFRIRFIGLLTGINGNSWNFFREITVVFDEGI